ncbi:MAG: hypothetical protein WAM71_22455 [Candidatus Korobacteraceae bacterium]
MASSAFKLAVGFLLAATSICNAQQNKTIRVCVNVQTTTLAGSINNSPTVNPIFLKMQTKALSERKPDKSHHFVLEGITVPELGMPPSGIPDRSPYEKYGRQLSDEDLKLAQGKSCDYVLFSLLSTNAAQFGEVPHTAFPTPQQSIGAPYGGADTRAPEVNFLVIYRLHQITPRAPVIEGTVSARDTAPGYGLTMRAFDLVAAQVSTKIANNLTIPTHAP